MVPRPAAELPAIDLACFGRVVAAAFNQRRKILRNALGDLASEKAFHLAGVDPLARAETHEWLARRGYVLRGFENVLGRRLARDLEPDREGPVAGSPSAPAPEIDVRAVEDGEVERLQAVTRIGDEHESDERIAGGQVLPEEVLPLPLDVAGNGRIAVAWKVDGEAAALQAEQVDLLGPSRRAAREGEAGAVGKRVDRARLARVGPAREGDLGRPGRRQLRTPRRSEEELGPHERGRRHGRGRVLGRCCRLRYNVAFVQDGCGPRTRRRIQGCRIEEPCR